MRKFIKLFLNCFVIETHREIMLISYDFKLNKIECIDWYSVKIDAFCGVFDEAMLERIKPYCRLGDFPHTKIYIWAGMQKKHLAYGEPVENYLKDINLWKTGQGFHFGSGVRYGQSEKIKCSTCGK